MHGSNTTDANVWQPYQGGITIQQQGSEGTIIRDEVYMSGSGMRISLESNRNYYAITCGLPGWLVHTCHVDNLDYANSVVEEMKYYLEILHSTLLDKNSTTTSQQLHDVNQLLSDFVERYS